MKRPASVADALICPSRRVFLAGAGAFVAWANLPKPAYADPGREPRFVAVILRGAMDGLAVVPPVEGMAAIGIGHDVTRYYSRAVSRSRRKKRRSGG